MEKLDYKETKYYKIWTEFSLNSSVVANSIVYDTDEASDKTVVKCR